MTVKKTYRQTGGTVVTALFTDDGKQVQINDGTMKHWAPVDLETLDLPQDSLADKEAKRAAHVAAKAQLEREIAHEKSGYAGITVDKRAGTIEYEAPLQFEVKEEPIWLVETPNKRRR